MQKKTAPKKPIPKETMKAYVFLRGLKNPKSQRGQIIKLAKKHIHPSMLGLFDQFAKSFLRGKKKTPPTKEQKKLSEFMTLFMILGYLIRSVEGEPGPKKPLSMKNMARQRPRAV